MHYPTKAIDYKRCCAHQESIMLDKSSESIDTRINVP